MTTLDMGSTQFYNRKFLSDKGSSAAFLRAIAYDVNMSSKLIPPLITLL
jgi:hypothetical protein